jgi:hypothetical protein
VVTEQRLLARRELHRQDGGLATAPLSHSGKLQKKALRKEYNGAI